MVKTAVNKIHWVAREVSRRRIVLHAFRPLSERKSSVAFAMGTIEGVRERHEGRGYEASLTPFATYSSSGYTYRSPG